MGLLNDGKALSWKSSDKFIQHVKDNGISQFIRIYNTYKDVQTNHFVWGDECEYIILKKLENGFYKVSHNGYKVIDLFDCIFSKEKSDFPCKLISEYGSFMVESTPATPYRGNTCDLVNVESNMRKRRLLISCLLEENEYIFSISNFFLLGTKDYYYPLFPFKNDISKSIYLTDDSINPHQRFSALTENIRKRRGCKVDIRAPLFIDKNTQTDIDYIKMDSMGFGMGCCCLQVTLQAQNMKLSRFLYDQLLVLSPIFLAVTASTPFHKGMISDWDVRWNVISQSVDCRNPSELGDNKLNETNQRISQSRFSSASLFLSLYDENNYNKLNNVDLKINKKCYKRLVSNGVDKPMAKHIARLFIRDPLVIYKEYIYQDNSVSVNHFENIQSTNWQTCRIKPPNSLCKSWRVEFRSMEIQMTDFENAAFSIFIALLSRAILYYGTQFYIPIDLVHKNMLFAHKRNAYLEQKFFFKVGKKNDNNNDNINFEHFERMNINEIFNGNNYFIGLIQLVRNYIELLKFDKETKIILEKYFRLIKLRSSGKLMTAARWLREKVKNHSKYKKDSILTENICKDLLNEIKSISEGEKGDKLLLGEFRSPKLKKYSLEIEKILKDFKLQKLKEYNFDIRPAFNLKKSKICFKF